MFSFTREMGIRSPQTEREREYLDSVRSKVSNDFERLGRYVYRLCEEYSAWYHGYPTDEPSAEEMEEEIPMSSINNRDSSQSSGPSIKNPIVIEDTGETVGQGFEERCSSSYVSGRQDGFKNAAGIENDDGTVGQGFEERCSSSYVSGRQDGFKNAAGIENDDGTVCQGFEERSSSSYVLGYQDGFENAAVIENGDGTVGQEFEEWPSSYVLGLQGGFENAPAIENSDGAAGQRFKERRSFPYVSRDHDIIKNVMAIVEKVGQEFEERRSSPNVSRAPKDRGTVENPIVIEDDVSGSHEFEERCYSPRLSSIIEQQTERINYAQIASEFRFPLIRSSIGDDTQSLILSDSGNSDMDIVQDHDDIQSIEERRSSTRESSITEHQTEPLNPPRAPSEFTKPSIRSSIAYIVHDYDDLQTSPRALSIFEQQTEPLNHASEFTNPTFRSSVAYDDAQSLNPSEFPNPSIRSSIAYNDTQSPILNDSGKSYMGILDYDDIESIDERFSSPRSSSIDHPSIAYNGTQSPILSDSRNSYMGILDYDDIESIDERFSSPSALSIVEQETEPLNRPSEFTNPGSSIAYNDGQYLILSDSGDSDMDTDDDDIPSYSPRASTIVEQETQPVNSPSEFAHPPIRPNNITSTDDSEHGDDYDEIQSLIDNEVRYWNNLEVSGSVELSFNGEVIRPDERATERSIRVPLGELDEDFVSNSLLEALNYGPLDNGQELILRNQRRKRSRDDFEDEDEMNRPRGRFWRENSECMVAR